MHFAGVVVHNRTLPYVSGMLLGAEGSSVQLALSRTGPSSSSTSLLTSDDTREANRSLESGQILT